METIIYVITWRYSDGSGSGVVRAYEQKDEAEEDMKFLDANGNTAKNFYIVETPFK